MLNLTRFAAFASVLAVSAPGLAAEEVTPPDPTERQALSLEGASGLAWIKNQSTYEPLAPYYFFAFAPSYRLSRVVSLGGLASYANPIGGQGGVRMWRASGEARAHAVRTRAVDIWTGAEIGLTLTRLLPSACGDCATPGTPLRVQPLVGGAVGAELLLSPYFSIGAEWRGMLIVFGSAEDREEPSGVSPAMFAGLTLGAHLPLR
jgi:hypothetical protein